MAVAFRSVGVSPGANGTTCVVVKPAGLTVGDLMIAHIVFASSGVITDPGAWTDIRQDSIGGGTQIRAALFWKIATSGDVSASDFTFTGTFQGNRGAITAWTGHHGSSPINANNGQTNSGTTTITAPAITPSVADCVVLLFGGVTDDETVSGYAIATDNPGSWTEAYDINTTQGDDVTVAMGYADRPETSSTGNGTATNTGLSDTNVGQLVAIAPAGVFTETASVIIGVLPAASRTLAADRDSSVIVGVVVTASRVWGRIRTASVIIGVVVSASRIWGRARAASVIVGIAVSATVTSILEWIVLTLRKRFLGFTLRPRKVSLSLQHRTFSFTLRGR